MKTVAEKIKELREREAAVLGMGGEKRGGEAARRRQAHGPGASGPLFRPRDLPGNRYVRHPPLGQLRHGKGRDPGRRRHHRLRVGKRPPGLRLLPGLHRPGGLPGRDARQEDLQGHGPGPEGRRAPGGLQRLRRGPHPGGGGFAFRLRADFLSQRHRLRRHSPDFGHHGTHRRRRGLLPGHDRLHLHGEEHLLHVHHRPGRHQERHRRADQL